MFHVSMFYMFDQLLLQIKLFRVNIQMFFFVIVDLKPSENARCFVGTLCNTHFNAGTITQQDINTTINAPHNVIIKFIVHLRSLHRPTVTVLLFGKHKQSAYSPLRIFYILINMDFDKFLV